MGKAHTISKRTGEHIDRGRPESDWKKDESHYSVARQAGQKQHIVLCILASENDRVIAEQVFINLFECWAINAIPLQTAESKGDQERCLLGGLNSTFYSSNGVRHDHKP